MGKWDMPVMGCDNPQPVQLCHMIVLVSTALPQSLGCAGPCRVGCWAGSPGAFG